MGPSQPARARRNSRRRRHRREPLPEGTVPRSPITRPEYRLGKTPANAGKRYPLEFITPDEVMRMIDACLTRPRNHRSSGIRNAAMIGLLYRCGLRVGELVDLEVKDLDLDRGLVTILHGKGDERRVVIIDDFAGKLLRDWLAERAELLSRESQWPGSTPDAGAAFCIVNRPTIGRPMHDNSARQAVKHIARKAGIRRRIHPHGFRGSVATEWMLEGASLVAVKELLGHKDLATTERYINKMIGSAVMHQFARERPAPMRHAA